MENGMARMIVKKPSASPSGLIVTTPNLARNARLNQRTLKLYHYHLIDAASRQGREPPAAALASAAQESLSAKVGAVLALTPILILTTACWAMLWVMAMWLAWRLIN
jgi:hypothetical protein